MASTANCIHRLVTLMSLFIVLGHTIVYGQQQEGPRKPIFISRAFDSLYKIKPLTLANARISQSIKKTTDVDGCLNQTFRARIELPSGQPINLAGMHAMPDGSFAITGTQYITSENHLGFIGFVAPDGQPTPGSFSWYQVNGSYTSIQSMSVLGDGRIVLGGYYVENGRKKGFVGLHDPRFVNTWIRNFTYTDDITKVTVDITHDNTILVAAEHGASIGCQLFDLNGTVIWSREVMVAGKTGLVGFRNSNLYDPTLVTNTEIAGRKQINFTDLAMNSGDIMHSHNTGATGEENLGLDARNWSNRLITAKIARESSGNYSYKRSMQGSGGEVELEHTWTIPGTMSWAITSAMDHSGDIMAICIPQDGQLISIMHLAAYNGSTNHTRTYNVPVGSTMAGVARSSQDGGFLMGLNVPGSDGILLIKTDSTGQTPACGNGTLSLSSSIVFNLQNVEVVTASSNPALSRSNGSWNASGSASRWTVDCHERSCPPVPPEDTCMTSFHKIYRTGTFGGSLGSVYQMENNNLIIQAGKIDKAYDNSFVGSGGLALFDSRGNWISGKTIFYDGVAGSGGSIQTDPRHIVVARYQPFNGVPATTVTKYDLNLNVVWSKTHQTTSPDLYWVNDITSDEEGNLYLVTTNFGYLGTPKVQVLKLDASGNQVWTKLYHTDASGYLFTAKAVATANSLVILSQGTTTITTLNIDRNTGQVSNAYVVNGVNVDGSGGFTQVGFYQGKIYALVPADDYRAIAGVFDHTGKALRFSRIQNSDFMRSTAIRDGGIYLNYSNYLAGEEVMVKLDTSLQVVYANSQPEEFGGMAAGMAVDQQGAVYVTNNSYPTDANTGIMSRLMKFDAKGKLGNCNSIGTLPVMEELTFTQAPRTFTEQAPTPYYNNGDVVITTLPETDGHRVLELRCVEIPKCTSVSVSAPPTVCDTSLVYRYEAVRNPGCDLPVKWIYDTAMLRVQQEAGDLLEVKFRRTGQVTVIAALMSGCKIYLDTTVVDVQHSSLSISLGSDKTLCPSESVELSPGNGFSSYLWNDGSTGETLVVTTAGVYFVEVTNSCGINAKDTIIIRPFNPPVLDLGPDRQACIGDTLRFTANNGFTSYNWTGSGLNSTTGQFVYAVAAIGGNYSVMATTTDGCQVSDMLSISTVAPQQVRLMEDTAFCAGNSLLLDAGSGFSGYQWSNGQSGSGISVSQSGMYWVEITDVNGCHSRDTMNLRVNALPVVSLGADFNLCEGQSRVLDPGFHYSYTWQDGHMGRTYDISDAGRYWVTVTSADNCAVTDTLVVNRVIPLPANFLNSTDSVCSYDHISLKPTGNFRSYSWSTGSASSSISVSTPGIYTLTVTDVTGCTGTDSITIIPKTCYTGIYVPTVFTPNGDGINDTFKAGVWGNVIDFKLQVFNRWGQLIYQTTDPAKGWDGNVNGIPQDTNVFVWQCTHNIQGQQPGYLKGTVHLIR